MLVRVTAGAVAAAVFFFAQGIASAEDALLGDVILALTAHGVAAAIIFSVFFNSHRTRVRSLIPLAEAPLEVKALGRERHAHLMLERLRLRLGWTYVVIAFVVVAAVVMLAFARQSYPLAALVIESRGGYLWLSLAFVGAGLVLVTGFGLLASRTWALFLADVSGFVLSAGFPLGTAVALYTWWGTRTLRGAVNAIRTQAVPSVALTNALVSAGEAPRGRGYTFEVRRGAGFHVQARWRLVSIGIATAFAYFVWPTPWRYDRLRGVQGNEVLVRVNRFTGTTQLLSPAGWQERASR